MLGKPAANVFENDFALPFARCPENQIKITKD
jgi:hypothetical protein